MKMRVWSLAVAVGVALLVGCGKPSADSAGTTTGQGADAAFEAAVDLHDAGQLDEAIAAYDAILAADAEHVDALVNRGVAYLEQEKYGVARQDFEAAIKLAPEDAELYRLRGDVASAESRFQAAAADYGKSLQLDAAQPLVHMHRSLIWQVLGETEAAVADLSLAISLYPDDPTPYERRRDIIAALDLEGAPAAAAAETALLTLTEAIVAAPEDTAKRLERAVLFFDRGEMDACAYDLAVILETAPTHTRALLYRAHLRMIEGNQDAALADYEAVIAAADVDPQSASDAHLGRSFIYDSLGAGTQSRDDRMAAVALMPESAEAHRLLAWQLATVADANLRDPTLAVTHARRAVELGTDEPWLASDTLAAALAAAGDFAAAKSTQRSAIDAAPKWAHEDMEKRLALYEQSTPYTQQP